MLHPDHLARTLVIVIPGAAALAFLLFLIFSHFKHKKALWVTLALLILFSGDTAKRMVDFYTGAPGLPDAFGGVNNSFPFTNLLLTLAVGILLYFFLEFIFARMGEIPPAEDDNNSVWLLNTVIVSVLAFSFFIVISVFTTIPYLSNLSKPTIYTQANLDSTLKEIARTPVDFPVPPQANLPKIDDSVQVAAGAAANNLGAFIIAARDWTGKLRADRDRLEDSLQRFGYHYQIKETEERQLLVQEYGNASQNLRTDKSQLYETALNWFMSYRGWARDSYEEMRTAVQVADRNNVQLIMTLNQEIRQGKNRETDSFHMDTNMPAYSPYPNAPPVNTYLPVLHAAMYDGSDWGVFGLMSQYLIRTGSSELVLLIGMLGFGLLGASLSSFKASKKHQNLFQTFRSEPLVTNFSYVLIRGCGAAIAVYLCTKAGLAVFTLGTTTSAGDTNSYMLLLTCFIAAIYSDRVWSMISDTLAPALKSAPSGSSVVGGKNNPPPAGAKFQVAGAAAGSDLPVIHDPNDLQHDPPEGPPAYLKTKNKPHDPELPDPKTGA